MKRFGIIIAFVSLCLAFAGTAHASSSRDVTYRYSKIWSGVVRFLRVDNRFPLVEKAKKEGYVLFEYKYRGRERQASFEFVPVVKTNRKYIRIILRIGGMPSYVERVLLDKFKLKLRTEYGYQPEAQLVTKSDSKKKDGNSTEGATGGDEELKDEDELEVEKGDLEDSPE